MKRNYSKIIDFVSELAQVNWSKTIYINFRMLSLRDAIKFPIIIWGKCRLALKGGKIVFDVPVRRALLKIGYRYETFYSKEPSQVKIHGVFTLKGEVWFGSSTQILVEPKATLTMGQLSSMGTHASLVCTKSVLFSEYSRVGSFSYISDSNYHYMKNVKDNSILPFNKPIKIGARNYIGSKVSLLPGTVTPDNIVIGYGSVCNKDYRNIIPENSVIAGIPAKLVKKDTVRIFDFEKEDRITSFFAESGNDIYYDV